MDEFSAVVCHTQINLKYDVSKFFQLEDFSLYKTFFHFSFYHINLDLRIHLFSYWIQTKIYTYTKEILLFLYDYNLI